MTNSKADFDGSAHGKSVDEKCFGLKKPLINAIIRGANAYCNISDFNWEYDQKHGDKHGCDKCCIRQATRKGTVDGTICKCTY